MRGVMSPPTTYAIMAFKMTYLRFIQDVWLNFCTYSSNGGVSCMS